MTVEKKCIHCGADKGTAKLWKLKCNQNPRHNFKPTGWVNEGMGDRFIPKRYLK